MQINRRQFVASSTAALIVPSVFAAPSEPAIDRELTGKVICGYQGWFNAPGDGMGLGFRHYGITAKKLEHAQCSIDFWPDLREYPAEHRYDTPFLHQDGRPAQLFSSADAKTVELHHQWMREHDIDGAALQRFGLALNDDKLHRMRDRVLKHTREAALKQARLWMNMYDLSGMPKGKPQEVIANDWLRLVEEQHIAEDAGYLHHHGKPVVAIWGVGFNDNRDYTTEDCAHLIDRISMGGRCSVMLGTPYHWRTQTGDASRDPALHDVLRKADILSPWAVGRMNTPDDVNGRLETHLKPDIAWCKDAGLSYLPVIFPGFSWHNLQKMQGVEAELDQIPRRGGAFMWAQAEAARKAGAESLYVAMFDEMDEGTCIFKCTNDPPIGENQFLTYGDLPSDHYLWVTGQIGKRLREGKGPAIKAMPQRVS